MRSLSLQRVHAGWLFYGIGVSLGPLCAHSVVRFRYWNSLVSPCHVSHVIMRVW